MRTLGFIALLVICLGQITRADADVVLPDARWSVAVRAEATGVAIYIASGAWEPTVLPAYARNTDPTYPYVLVMTLGPNALGGLLKSLDDGPEALGASSVGAFGGQRIVWWRESSGRSVAVLVGDGDPAKILVGVLTERDRKELAGALRRAAALR